MCVLQANFEVKRQAAANEKLSLPLCVLQRFPRPVSMLCAAGDRSMCTWQPSGMCYTATTP